jgi:hypothetical protein
MISVESIFIHGIEDRNVGTAAVGHNNFIHLVTSASFKFIRESSSSIDSHTSELGP